MLTEIERLEAELNDPAVLAPSPHDDDADVREKGTLRVEVRLQLQRLKEQLGSL